MSTSNKAFKRTGYARRLTLALGGRKMNGLLALAAILIIAGVISIVYGDVRFKSPQVQSRLLPAAPKHYGKIIGVGLVFAGVLTALQVLSK